MTGAIGYLLIYIALITLAVQKGMIVPNILCALAIVFFLLLCGIGFKADLHDPKTHWVIEISNILSQLLVAISAAILFL